MLQNLRSAPRITGHFQFKPAASPRPAVTPERRISGRDWFDGVLITQMVDELARRHADIVDQSSVRAKLEAANFSQDAIERLSNKAAEVAAAQLTGHGA